MLLPEGIYLGTCKDIGMDTSSKGSSFLDIVFEVTQYSQDSEWVAISPVDRHLRVYLTEASKQYSEPKLLALKFNGDFTGDPQITDEWVELECSHKLYEGNQQENWELPGGGNSERKPPPIDELRRLTSWYKTSAANTKKPPGKPKLPVKDGPPPDDISF